MRIFLLPLLCFVLPLKADDKEGVKRYALCGGCHGMSGEGTAVGPPLAGSEWVNGPAENLIRIQLRGLQGPISVKGVEYNFAAPMPPLAYQSDDEIASVLTFVRSSFGNKATPVTAADVAALRGEPKEPMLTAADLIAPAHAAGPARTGPGKYDHLEAGEGIPIWIITSLAIAGLGGAYVLLRRA